MTSYSRFLHGDIVLAPRPGTGADLMDRAKSITIGELATLSHDQHIRAD